MPTQKAGYRLADGTRVPSVTTILGRFKESGGLIHWSWKLAYEPLMQARALLLSASLGNGLPDALGAFLAISPDDWDYRAKRDRAADAGTLAHEMVDCWIRRQKFDESPHDPAMIEKAHPAFNAFLEWADQTRLEVIETEVPLVSERHRFGGTRDAIMISGKRALGDWKTSNAIYSEYLAQLGAYGILDEEKTGLPLDGGYHLLRFSKQEKPSDPVQFTHHFWSQMDTGKRAFLLMRELYDLMAELKKFTN